MINPRTQCGTSRSPPSLDFSHPRLNSSGDRALAYYKERVKEGKVIRVQDVAFITYVFSFSVPTADRQISPVSKRFYSTCTRVISSSPPSDPKPTAKPELLKPPRLSRIAYLDLRLNLSTALPIRYLLLRLIAQPFQLTTAAQYDVPELKYVALEQIEEGLRRCDAFRETFSRFSSQ
jgi:hypothetical protein